MKPIQSQWKPQHGLHILKKEHLVHLELHYIALKILDYQPFVSCIDGNNSFNVHFLADVCKFYHFDIKDKLTRIYVSRNFTVHQITRNIIGMKDSQPLIILGLLELFLDEQVREHEARYLFQTILKRLINVSRNQVVLVSLDTSRLVTKRAVALAKELEKCGSVTNTLTNLETIAQLIENRHYLHMHY